MPIPRSRNSDSNVSRFLRASRRLCVAIIFCSLVACGVVAAKPSIAGKRLLVVTVTKGFRHESIPTAERVLGELAARHRLDLDFARTDEELRLKTTRAALKSYAGIVFASTTGDLPLADRDAFLGFIRDGGAFIGIHAATDTFRKGAFPGYSEMIGGEFEGHGPQKSVNIRIDDGKHPATRDMKDSALKNRSRDQPPNTLTVYDEIYRINNFDRSRVRLLLSLDRHPDTDAPGLFPLAWCRDYGKGKVFYTALGHRDDVLESDWFRRHLAGGMLWAIKAKDEGGRMKDE